MVAVLLWKLLAVAIKNLEVAAEEVKDACDDHKPAMNIVIPTK